MQPPLPFFLLAPRQQAWLPPCPSMASPPLPWAGSSTRAGPRLHLPALSSFPLPSATLFSPWPAAAGSHQQPWRPADAAMAELLGSTSAPCSSPWPSPLVQAPHPLGRCPRCVCGVAGRSSSHGRRRPAPLHGRRPAARLFYSPSHGAHLFLPLSAVHGKQLSALPVLLLARAPCS
jgi:hypothetical protein